MLKALILCGGKGTRMRPFTFSKPKQLLKVANESIISYVLKNIKSAGIKDIGIVVNEKNISNFIEELKDGKNYDVNLSYIIQKEPLGLAHAVKCAKDFLKDEDFLLYLGDNLIRTDVKSFVEKFKEDVISSLILVDEVDDPSRFGVVIMDEKRNEVMKLVEKPKEFVSNLAIIGMYMFDKNIFNAIEMIKPSSRGEYEITDAIDQLLKMNLKVKVMKLKGWWKDIGKPEDLLNTNMMILSEKERDMKNEGELMETKIVGKVNVCKCTHVEKSTLVGPITIGKNVRIERSRIGPNVSIEDDVEIRSAYIENTIIMNHCRIENITLVNSVVGENATIFGNNERLSIIIGDFGRLKIQS